MASKPTYQGRTRATRHLTVSETLDRTTLNRDPADHNALMAMRADMLLVLRRCLVDELANEFGVDCVVL